MHKEIKKFNAEKMIFSKFIAFYKISQLSTNEYNMSGISKLSMVLNWWVGLMTAKTFFYG